MHGIDKQTPIMKKAKTHRNERISRRAFLTTATTGATVALAGCTGSGGSTSAGNSTGGGSSESADTISIAAVGGGEGELFRDLINNYVVDDTGINVNVQLFPYSNLLEKTNSVLTAQSDAFDIMFMDDPWFPQFASNVEPLQQWLPEGLPRDQIIENCVKITTWPTPNAPKVPAAEELEQKVRGQVIVGNTQLYAYNQRHYDKVGAKAPETWADVLEAGKRINNQIDGTNGYIIRGKQGNPAMANFFSLGNSIGGEMFTKNWRYNWAGEAGTKAVEFWAQDLKEISPEGVTSFDSDAVLNGLSGGTVAQAPAWPAAASTLLDPDNSKEAKNIAFTPIPKGHIGAKRRSPTQGNWILGINSYIDDSKKKASGKVIQSAISAEAQSKYVELGGVPFRHDTFENHMDAQPWFPALYESLQNAQWRPRTPLYSEFGVNHGQLLNTALSGNLSPKAMTRKAQDQIESTLDTAGYYK